MPLISRQKSLQRFLIALNSLRPTQHLAPSEGSTRDGAGRLASPYVAYLDAPIAAFSLTSYPACSASSASAAITIDLTLSHMARADGEGRAGGAPT